MQRMSDGEATRNREADSTASPAAGHSGEWVFARFRTHLYELLHLSWPAMLSRLGLLALSVVDTIMVGRYATAELAWLSLANRAVVMFLLVVAIGLLMGVIVSTASAYGRKDYAECGRIWRRTLPYALGIGFVMAAITAAAPVYTPWLAKDALIASKSADLVLILGLGLPAHVLFYSSTAFLEGIRRPQIPMLILLAANALNVLLNTMLVYGNWGAPEMGAAGSAWTSTIVRWTMLGTVIAYILTMPSMQPFGVRRPHGQRWRDWAHQRAIGYASAISIAAEVGAFAGLAVIAEKLGQLQLAGQEIVFNVLTVPFMIAVGIGSATAVRVGIAHGRGDPLDTGLAGWTGLVTSMTILGLIALAIHAYPGALFALHSEDARLALITVPAIAFVAYITAFDGGQAVISMGLRGLGETWWPTAIQAIAYVAIMLPCSWYLAMVAGRGLVGLLEAALIASIFSVAAQSLRFWWLTGRAKAFTA